MGLLSGAMPQKMVSDDQIQVKSEKGSYRAYFVGMTERVEKVSPFGDVCRLCKGARTGFNGNGDCRACHGSGKKTDMMTRLRYELENGLEEEEEVAFKMTPASKNKAGEPLSASKLFVRLREFSGRPNATAEELDEWYSSLTYPIRVPVQVNIGQNNNASALKITDVVTRRSSTAARPTQEPPKPAPAPAPVAASSGFDNDDDIPF